MNAACIPQGSWPAVVTYSDDLGCIAGSVPFAELHPQSTSVHDLDFSMYQNITNSRVHSAALVTLQSWPSPVLGDDVAAAPEIRAPCATVGQVILCTTLECTLSLEH